MIRIEQVSKYFGPNRALNNISLEIESGETLILLGPSGCGKTTTLRLINRLVEPSSGRISLAGKDISTEQPEKLRRSMGYVLQHHGLFPHYTVAENLAIVPRLLKWEKQRIARRSNELLEKLSLPPAEYAHAYPSELSGGQQQRVGLARALMADPPVLLMDEPLGALDPLTRASIRREFKNLDELKKKTIVMVTHDVEEAFEMGDRICLMERGNIGQLGSPADLLFHPQSEFVNTFFSRQRLQLELRSISLAQLWHMLPQYAEGKSTEGLNSSCSLWEAMEYLSESPGTLTIKKENKEQRILGFTELMEAYSRYKNQEA